MISKQFFEFVRQYIFVGEWNSIPRSMIKSKDWNTINIKAAIGSSITVINIGVVMWKEYNDSWQSINYSSMLTLGHE